MDEILVGLAGYGFGGAMFHAPFIAVTPRLRLAAVATSRRAEVERDFPSARVRPGAADLVADPDIGLLVVSTPTSTHFEIARSALECGKHVVIDKPMVVTTAEADELIALAAARHRVLSVYQNRRWDGDFRTVKAIIEQRRIGELYYYESRFDRFSPQIKPGWREQAEPGSGVLYDRGSHLIDQAVSLFGVPHAVMADVFCQRPGARAEDYFHLVLDYGPRRVVLHGSNLVCEPGPHFTVHGDGGSFLKYGLDPQEEALKAGLRPGAPDWGRDNPEQYGLLVRADGTASRVATLPGGYEKYYEMLAACLLDGGPVPVDPRDSRNGIAIIEAAFRSAKERRTVAPGVE
jgi:scyllo-inositol 2-dehydrogenase (NADP+)